MLIKVFFCGKIGCILTLINSLPTQTEGGRQAGGWGEGGRQAGGWGEGGFPGKDFRTREEGV